MKKILAYLLPLALLASACQPKFEMTPPKSGTVKNLEFAENYYVTAQGDGLKDGDGWGNALPFSEFLTRLSDPERPLADACFHIREGNYTISFDLGYLPLSKTVGCVRGGYSKELTLDDLSKCDPDRFPTVFNGGGDGAFIYLTEGELRFDNICFKNFLQPTDMATNLVGRGSAVFGINGATYQSASVNCNGCRFEGNVNGYDGSSSSYDGGSCVFLSKGYFKARDCVFRDNRSRSRGGAIRTYDKQSVLFLDRCLFTGNTLSASFGSAIQNTSGTVCMNNCTLVDNVGAGGTLNGGGSFFVANSTLLDSADGSDVNNAAFRCESAEGTGSLIVASVFSHKGATGTGIHLNGVLTSRGYNLIKNVSLTAGKVDPTTADDSVRDQVLEGAFEGNCWKWNLSQVSPAPAAYATVDPVYAAALSFNPYAYCGVYVLGRVFASWVGPASFALDCRKSARGLERFQMGAYDPNIDL